MKKHNILTKSLAAIVAVTLVGQTAFAAAPYSADDLLLGFRANGGTGADKDVVVNIGQASLYSGASSSFVVSTGSIKNDLSTAFGSNWNAHRADGSNGGLGSDVIWSISGTSGLSAVGSDAAKTNYATKAQASLGVPATAWNSDTDTAQGVTSSKMRGFANSYKTNYTVSGNGAVIQLKSDVNSYASYQPGGTTTNSGPAPGTSFATFNPTAQSTSALGSADLFRMPVYSGSGSAAGTRVGTFALDAQGNLNFIIGSATPTPTLAAPASSSSNSLSVALNYTLPVSAKAGSLTVDFNDGTAHVLTLASAASTPGAHTFWVDPQNPTASENVASGAAIPDGSYTVTVSYQDLVGNTAATAASTSVVVDSHAPVVDASGVATTGYDSTHGIPDLRGSLAVTDYSSVTTTQSPAAGTIHGAGMHTVTFTSADALGNQTVTPVNITVAVGAPVSTVVGIAGTSATPGTAVPGAGVTPGIAANAVFSLVGVPAINDAGDVAFQAKWTAAAVGATPKSSGWGIFGGHPTTLIAKVGDSAPGVTLATIKSLKDPVINAAGKVAFPAAITGGTVTPTSDSVLLTNAIGGSLSMVAREGSAVSGEADGATILSITNVSLQGSEVLYTAKLNNGTPAVTPANDLAAFSVDATGTHHVIREGDSLAGSTVKTFKLLGADGLTSAQTRGHAVGTSTFQALLVSGSAVLADSTVATLPAANTISIIKKTGDLTGGATLPATTFKSLAAAVAADGAQEVTLGVLNIGHDGVVSTNNTGIFLGTGSEFEPVARFGDTAITGTKFSAFNDPLISNGAVAFPAKEKDGAGVQTLSLWWKPATGSLTEIANMNSEPPSATGSTYKAFNALAIADAPLYYAQIQGGTVTADTDFALFAVNTGGSVSKIVREGDVVSGKTIKSFTVLSIVGGSAGVTHSFNANRQVAYSAKFTDGTSGIIITTIP